MKRDIIKNLEEYREKSETGQFNESVKLKITELFKLIDFTLNEKEGNDVWTNGFYIKIDRDPRVYMYDLLLNVWNAGYMSGYKNGRAKRKKSVQGSDMGNLERDIKLPSVDTL